MSRDLYLKMMTMVFGIVAILAMGACSAVGSTDPAIEQAESEPTTIPTPTAVATEESATSTPTEPPASPTPETTPAPDVPADVAEERNEGENTASDANEAVDGARDPGAPVYLRIDRIGVEAGFEYVGVTPEGNMDVPQGWDNVAWYEPGTVPGAQGNSVITGHYDRPGGARAIFYDLNHLVPGDRITILTEHNEELIFEITEIEVVHVSEAPLKKIFGRTDERNLNLITCDGVWDSSAGMYNQRLIVYSTLVSA